MFSAQTIQQTVFTQIYTKKMPMEVKQNHKWVTKNIH